MRLGAGDPPALSGQSIRLAHDQHCELRLAAFRRFIVDKAEHLAERTHLGPRKVVTESARISE